MLTVLPMHEYGARHVQSFVGKRNGFDHEYGVFNFVNYNLAPSNILIIAVPGVTKVTDIAILSQMDNKTVEIASLALDLVKFKEEGVRDPTTHAPLACFPEPPASKNTDNVKTGGGHVVTVHSNLAALIADLNKLPDGYHLNATTETVLRQQYSTEVSFGFISVKACAMFPTLPLGWMHTLDHERKGLDVKLLPCMLPLCVLTNEASVDAKLLTNDLIDKTPGKEHVHPFKDTKVVLGWPGATPENLAIDWRDNQFAGSSLSKSLLQVSTNESRKQKNTSANKAMLLLECKLTELAQMNGMDYRFDCQSLIGLHIRGQFWNGDLYYSKPFKFKGKRRAIASAVEAKPVSSANKAGLTAKDKLKLKRKAEKEKKLHKDLESLTLNDSKEEEEKKEQPAIEVTEEAPREVLGLPEEKPEAVAAVAASRLPEDVVQNTEPQGEDELVEVNVKRFNELWESTQTGIMKMFTPHKTMQMTNSVFVRRGQFDQMRAYDMEKRQHEDELDNKTLNQYKIPRVMPGDDEKKEEQEEPEYGAEAVAQFEEEKTAEDEEEDGSIKRKPVENKVWGGDDEEMMDEKVQEAEAANLHKVVEEEDTVEDMVLLEREDASWYIESLRDPTEGKIAEIFTSGYKVKLSTFEALCAMDKHIQEFFNEEVGFRCNRSKKRIDELKGLSRQPSQLLNTELVVLKARLVKAKIAVSRLMEDEVLMREKKPWVDALLEVIDAAINQLYDSC